MNTRSLCLLTSLALACGPAQADPPYGDAFDAPATPTGAVGIAPNAPGTMYLGLYTFCPDVDFYRFAVAQGQDIEISCTSFPVDDSSPDGDDISHPCVVALIGPAENSSAPVTTTDGAWSHVSVTAADAGEWLLKVSGEDMEGPLFGSHKLSHYLFDVRLAPDSSAAAKGAGGGASAGAFGQFGLWLLGLAGALRRRAFRNAMSWPAVPAAVALAMLAAGCMPGVEESTAPADANKLCFVHRAVYLAPAPGQVSLAS